MPLPLPDQDVTSRRVQVSNAGCWKVFHQLFLWQPQRQRDFRFFSVLNKIRFGIIDEVNTALIERW
jgi:hypothetical protein